MPIRYRVGSRPREQETRRSGALRSTARCRDPRSKSSLVSPSIQAAVVCGCTRVSLNRQDSSCRLGCAGRGRTAVADPRFDRERSSLAVFRRCANTATMVHWYCTATGRGAHIASHLYCILLDRPTPAQHLVATRVEIGATLPDLGQSPPQIGPIPARLGKLAGLGRICANVGQM